MSVVGQNFIIFSSVDWTTHWQLHHQLSVSLVSTGNKVLFIENTGIRSANIGDIGRIGERISNWRKGLHGFTSIDGNKLTSYSPILLPFPYSKLSLFFNKKIFNLLIYKWVKASNFTNPIVISFLPTPLVQSAINSIKPVLTVYYCANNMTGSSISASQVKPYEDYFFKNVDIVFTAAYVIQKYAQKFSQKVFYFPPGIDYDKFKAALDDNRDIPASLNSINKPIVGYIGTLGRVLDQELLCDLADQCSDCNIIMIGPKYIDIKALESKPNIIFLGAKHHDYLPYYIKEFDVGIVPYVCNDFTEGVYPSKLNEYLSMGIPAVSTNLREVREFVGAYGEVVNIANNTQEFVDAVKQLISEKNSVSSKKQRIKVAKENSWESRFEGILKIIEKELTLKESEKKEFDWKKRFDNHFNLKSKRRKFVFVFFFIYLIIFYTPLFWLAGEQLIVKDPPKKSGAIVVFSGDGETSYQNLSYQKRALGATKLYRDGYSDKIFLSSGRRQTIADVKMIKLYLNSQGVPKKSIYILDKYPSSTYQNVKMVKQLLDNNKVTSILFVTAPYHSLRSELIWKKNAPNINITTPDIRNFLSKNTQWNIGFDKIRVIMYEYAAIAHNWILGRI
jgi:uncharacterized SAM-binding protein YcdF (DUF218 family)/glycosyltransferase involved in cell wall biosynthesis